MTAAESNATREIHAAVDRLAAGGLVAFPTETVWGLAALALSESALAALRHFKGRDEQQPISILVSGAADLPELGFAISEPASALMARFWPGPLTLVMPCPNGRFAAGIARGSDGAVGVRCSPHSIARALTLECAVRGLGPITATSLNRSGESPVISFAEACALCLGTPGGPTVLPQGPTPGPAAQPSTVIDLSSNPPRILRAGAVGRAMLEQTIGSLPGKDESR